MLFNDQLAPSEAALINAVNTLKANPTPITDLVLDIVTTVEVPRHRERARLHIAGPGPTAGQTFELQQFNAASSTDPGDGQPIAPTRFTPPPSSRRRRQPLPTSLLPGCRAHDRRDLLGERSVMNGLAAWACT